MEGGERDAGVRAELAGGVKDNGTRFADRPGHPGHHRGDLADWRSAPEKIVWDAEKQQVVGG